MDQTHKLTEKLNQLQAHRLKNEHFLVVITFVLVTVLLTWPILLQANRVYLTAPKGYYWTQQQGDLFVGHVTLGTEWVDHDLFTWQAEQTAARLRNFKPPILARSGSVSAVPPMYVVPAAILTIFLPFSTVVAHNLLFVGSMFLAGVFTFLFVRKVFGDPEVALLAGILFMSSFYIFQGYMFGHGNQWQIQWIPLVLYTVERVRTRSNLRNITLLSVAFVCQAMASMQYTIYMTFMLPIYLLLRFSYGAVEFRRLDFWKAFLAATGLALVLGIPYILAQLSMVGERPVRTIQQNLYRWYVVQNFSGVFFAADAPLQELFRIGLLVLGGGTLLTVSRRRQKQIIPFAFIFVIGVFLAWGPEWPWALYTVVYKFWPFVEYFRVPYRILPFAILGSSIVSAASLFHVSSAGERWTRNGVLYIGLIAAIQIALIYKLLQFSPYLLRV